MRATETATLRGAGAGRPRHFLRSGSCVDNPYMTAVGQVPGIFTPDECLWLSGAPLEQTAAGVYDARGPEARVDRQLRRTLERQLPRNREFAWVYARLDKVAREANDRAYHFRLDDRITAHVLEYEPDGFFDWHMDLGTGPTASRKLSLVTFLTPPEAYLGGELLFMDGGSPLRPAQGTTAVFPAYLLHKVNPVTQGTRCTLVAWLHGPCFT
ncbi:MAG: 2OG-Fe(II) oxygenase [Gammaproteobacteria bacterium]|nr:2OG-Fe(II) oxygenase [Gammaproteobacteria bacterium]